LHPDCIGTCSLQFLSGLVTTDHLVRDGLVGFCHEAERYICPAIAGRSALRCKVLLIPSRRPCFIPPRKTDHLQVMSARFDQDDFWDPNLFSMPLTGSIEYPGNYATAPVDATFAVCSLNLLVACIHFTAHSSSWCTSQAQYALSYLTLTIDSSRLHFRKRVPTPTTPDQTNLPGGHLRAHGPQQSLCRRQRRNRCSDQKYCWH
jgi:hypothetical protein